MRFWGVRGSIPTPGPTTARYGGNTPCIEVRIGDELVLFDLGTGIRGFGESAKPPIRGTIFISHYHYDHLQGLPFFVPIFNPRNEFTIRGPTREGRTVQDVISGQMQQPFFPVTAEMVFRAKLTYEPMAAGDTVRIGDGVVTALETNHPGGNLAYRIDCQGKSIVYATDTEHGTERDSKLIEFARGADIFIYDAMYTEDEYRGKIGSAKLGWGHSTWQTAVEIANTAGIGTLVLFHHDPTRSDDALDALVAEVRAVRKKTIAAREGLVLVP
ncbi:MAG: MBL fold metallo-hydrolase [Archangium sp.]|nr:MBL fold metallo-hydrolase [Archangium sp.]